MLESTQLLAFVRVTPEEVDDFLVVVLVVGAKLDLEGSRDLFDTFDVDDRWTEAAVTAEDLLLLISDYRG